MYCWKLTISINQSSKRIKKLMGMALSSVHNIRNEENDAEDPKFSLLQKRQKMETILSINLDLFDIDILWRTIQDFYIREKRVSTISKILPVLKEKMNFAYQNETSQKILREIGFTFKKAQNKRKILMERPDIILARTKFLKSIKKYREGNRSLIYIDETWIDSNLTF